MIHCYIRIFIGKKYQIVCVFFSFFLQLGVIYMYTAGSQVGVCVSREFY